METSFTMKLTMHRRSNVARSNVYATEYDPEAAEYVPNRKGDVHKKKELV